MKNYKFIISCIGCFLDGTQVSTKARDPESAESKIRDLLAKSKRTLPAVILNPI